MPVSRLIAAKPPPPPAFQTPETRFVRYQNRYQGWAAYHEFLKHIPPRASTSDSCETLLAPRIRLLLGGFRRYQTCWFWAVCGSRSPSWLENPHAYPGSSFDSVQTLSKGLGNVDRRGVCTLSDVRLLLGVGPPRPRMIAELIAAKPGLGWRGGVSQLSDVMLWVLMGSAMKLRNLGLQVAA